MLRLPLFLLGFLSASAFADVPHTFKAGDPVDADKFNQNFEALDQRIDDLISSQATNGNPTQPSRKLELITTTVTLDKSTSPSTITPIFTNDRGLQNIILKSVLSVPCDGAKHFESNTLFIDDRSGFLRGTMIIDNTHFVFHRTGEVLNIPVVSEIRESTGGCLSVSGTYPSTILIEYDEQ